jgi:hypothetical protein
MQFFETKDDKKPRQGNKGQPPQPGKPGSNMPNAAEQGETQPASAIDTPNAPAELAVAVDTHVADGNLDAAPPSAPSEPQVPPAAEGQE